MSENVDATVTVDEGTEAPALGNRERDLDILRRAAANARGARETARIANLALRLALGANVRLHGALATVEILEAELPEGPAAYGL